MPTDQSRHSVLDLREFVKSENERLYNFCIAILEDESLAEDVLLETFEDFVRQESKRKRKAEWEDQSTLKVALYQLAWQHAQKALLMRTYSIETGRDTRGMRGLGENILGVPDRDPSLVWNRLCFVDTEFRAPLVLHDLLGFDDEDVMEILGARWGVYRHRLHRGRMEFVEQLQGKPATAELEPAAAEVL